MTAMEYGNVLDYIREDLYIREKALLNNGEHKILYFDGKVKIRITKLKGKVYTVISRYGDKPIEKVIKNIITIQA